MQNEKEKDNEEVINIESSDGEQMEDKFKEESRIFCQKMDKKSERLEEKIWKIRLKRKSKKQLTQIKKLREKICQEGRVLMEKLRITNQVVDSDEDGKRDKSFYFFQTKHSKSKMRPGRGDDREVGYVTHRNERANLQSERGRPFEDRNLTIVSEIIKERFWSCKLSMK